MKATHVHDTLERAYDECGHITHSGTASRHRVRF